jgi:hypothetical protein
MILSYSVMLIVTAYNDHRDLVASLAIAVSAGNGFSFLNQRFPTSSALAIKATASPILTGAQCNGFVYFLFPPGLLQEMGGP